MVLLPWLWKKIKQVQPWVPTLAIIFLVIYVVNKIIAVKGALVQYNIPLPSGDKDKVKAAKKAYVDSLAALGQTPSLLESIALYLDSLNPFK